VYLEDVRRATWFGDVTGCDIPTDDDVGSSITRGGDAVSWVDMSSGLVASEKRPPE